MQRSVRTFIAVEISSEVQLRTARLIASFEATGANVRWVKPEHMHLTLKFLGDVDLREIPEVCAAVERATADVATVFAAHSPARAHFPTRAIRALFGWEPMKGAEEIDALHERSDESLAEIGFRAEQRRFRAHLTIGRVRNADRGMAELAAGAGRACRLRGRRHRRGRGGDLFQRTGTRRPDARTAWPPPSSAGVSSRRAPWPHVGPPEKALPIDALPPHNAPARHTARQDRHGNPENSLLKGVVYTDIVFMRSLVNQEATRAGRPLSRSRHGVSYYQNKDCAHGYRGENESSYGQKRSLHDEARAEQPRRTPPSRCSTAMRH